MRRIHQIKLGRNTKQDREQISTTVTTTTIKPRHSDSRKPNECISRNGEYYLCQMMLPSRVKTKNCWLDLAKGRSLATLPMKKNYEKIYTQHKMYPFNNFKCTIHISYATITTFHLPYFIFPN